MRDPHNRLSPGAGILGTMFFAGLFSLTAQALALRELLVIFFGNELTLGAILGFWLIGVSLGSLIISRFINRLSADLLRRLIAILLSGLAILLPFQIVAIRQIRSVLDLPFGEHISFGGMLFGTGVLLIPVCLVIGAIFPCACQLAIERYRHAVNRVYALDALGSMAGGIIFTFVLVRFMVPLSIAMLAGASALTGAGLLIRARRGRQCLAAAAVCMALAGLYPGLMAGAERAAVRARWRSFGYTFSRDTHGSSQLLYSTDSLYQNLALIETEGQKTLYANGQPIFTFPDPITAEHRIHFIMAQNPDAQSVLLIGGAPATDIPELLKYPIRRLLHVELDENIHRILEQHADVSYKQAMRDPRLEKHFMDGPRFVKTCREKFDVIISLAPSPTTVALNRYYTVEFFRDIARILAPGGFFYTSVDSTPHLQEASAGLIASIHGSLSAVFERVLITAGGRSQFFAGQDGNPLTFEREELFRRSAAARLRNDYFRPEYFLNAEEIDPARLDFVETRLGATRVPANSFMKPVSTYYSLMLWSRLSGSRLQSLFAGLRRVRAERIYASFPAAGLLFLIIGRFLRARRRRLPPASRSGMDRGWFRTMMGMVISSTGCCEMALQIILIFVFQNIFGYVYSRIGLIVAVYMMGLTLGAFSATRMTGPGKAWPWLFGLELVPAYIALLVPSLLMLFSAAAQLTEILVVTEISVFLLVMLAGWAGGAQFSLANRILRDAGGRTGATAAFANAADLLGSACGGFIVGVVLLPVLGIGFACMMLAALKAGSILCVLSALSVRPAAQRVSPSPRL